MIMITKKNIKKGSDRKYAAALHQWSWLARFCVVRVSKEIWLGSSTENIWIKSRGTSNESLFILGTATSNPFASSLNGTSQLNGSGGEKFQARKVWCTRCAASSRRLGVLSQAAGWSLPKQGCGNTFSIAFYFDDGIDCVVVWPARDELVWGEIW
jgi:hypothetical protein